MLVPAGPRSNFENRPAGVVPRALANLSAGIMLGVLSALSIRQCNSVRMA